MTSTVRVKAKITPWDDPAFVRAFEEARAEVDRSGCCPDGPEAASEVQRLLREGGFPDAHVEVVRSVQEALEHTSHWTVSRDADRDA